MFGQIIASQLPVGRLPAQLVEVSNSTNFIFRLLILSMFEERPLWLTVRVNCVLMQFT